MQLGDLKVIYLPVPTITLLEITSVHSLNNLVLPLLNAKYKANVILRQRIKLYFLRRQGGGSGVGVLWICVHCGTKTNYNQWQAYFRHFVLNIIFSHFSDTQTTCNFKKENAIFLPPLSHFPNLAKNNVIPLFKLLDCRKPENKPHYLVKRSELISDKDIYIYILIKFFFVYFVRFVNKPAGNVGLYDPAEIHNRHELKGFLKEAMIKLGFHLVFFFLYLYR